ncbi:MAG: hypothetical protein SCH98_06785 [Deferrisomatales bacterium]|nr:hypothetical protein [Deferrisomatales bacterium]
MFLFRARFWLFLGKVFLLAFVAQLALLQVPEILYDLRPREPVAVSGPDDLDPERLRGTIFASVQGSPDFGQAFVYRRYGLSSTYFQLEGYGPRLVIRTHEPVTEEWEQVGRFLGKLQPFERQPFSSKIREIYRERMGVEIPPGAFWLALDDVPRPSGWQFGGVAFSAVLWVLLFYLFFLRRRRAGRSRGPALRVRQETRFFR